MDDFWITGKQVIQSRDFSLQFPTLMKTDFLGINKENVHIYDTTRQNRKQWEAKKKV